MKINVFVFATFGASATIETFLQETDWENRMIQEMAGRSPNGNTPPGPVVELFREWTASERCPCERKYAWHSKEFELPVRVVVGLEGGCFLGAEATYEGISVEPFDWDEAREAFGEEKAVNEFDRIAADLIPLA